MNDIQQASAWCEQLTALGIDAYVDPRSATPPCVLIQPPSQTFDTGCSALCVWRVYSMVPGPGNLDAWQALAEMQPPIVDLLPVETRLYVSVTLSPDSQLNPSFLYQFEGSTDI